MPTERHFVQCDISYEVMCEAVPMVVRDMMYQFVRNTSPDWSTVRMDISRGPMNRWIMRLYGDGIRRPGGDLYGQGIRGDRG